MFTRGRIWVRQSDDEIDCWDDCQSSRISGVVDSGKKDNGLMDERLGFESVA